MKEKAIIFDLLNCYRYNKENNKEYNMTTEKITVTIPHELKERLVFVKDELKTSMSAIYKEALEGYLEKKELEKWERGFKLASQDEAYIELCNELGNDDGGLYEY